MNLINLHGMKLAALLLALATPLAALAADSENIIKYRKNMMKAIGAHTAAADAIIQGKVDYRGQLAGHALALKALSSDIPALFPPDSDFGKTKARDEVWTKRAAFEKSAKDSTDKVAAFAKAVQGGDTAAIAARFKEMGESCKACHKDFREEDN